LFANEEILASEPHKIANSVENFTRERGEKHGEHAEEKLGAKESESLGKGKGGKKGRKTKEETIALEAERRRKQEEKRAANPPTRTSDRLKNASVKPGGKM